MRHQIRAIIACLAVTVPAGCSREAEPVAGEPAGGAITLWTDSTELFMEHPALIVGQAGKFNVHLTDLTDFAPLRSGRITLRFTPLEGGEPVEVIQETPRAPGIYGPAPAFSRPGAYDLVILVESPQARDSIVVPGLTVYATADQAPREAEETGSAISFLKEQQWNTPGFSTAFAESGAVTETFEAAGEIVPAAGLLADVRAPLAGMIDLAGIADAPAEGQRVTRGQVLGYLVPSLGESGSALARARAELREAEDEHARAVRLVEADAVPRRRLNEAEIRLQAAREALTGIGGGTVTADGRLPITAPLAGIVARRSLLPGSRVEAGAPLFTIVDASRTWLRIAVPADRAAGLSAGTTATFQLPGSDRRYAAGRLVSTGTMIDSVTRTLPVIYEVSNPDGSVRIGSLATAQLGTGRRVTGVVIPSSSLIDEDGRPVAYVQADGESFERRQLVTGARHGDRVVVSLGIRAGERVVTGAAYQVRLASLSTSAPAHGHEH